LPQQKHTLSIIVEGADCAESALTICNSSLTLPDVVIIDEFMTAAGGQMLGHELCKELRGMHQFKRVVLIGCTGMAEEAARKFFDCGADAVWIKPMPQRDEALAQIVELLELLHNQEFEALVDCANAATAGSQANAKGTNADSRTSQAGGGLRGSEGQESSNCLNLSTIRRISKEAAVRKGEWSHVKRLRGEAEVIDCIEENRKLKIGKKDGVQNAVENMSNMSLEKREKKLGIGISGKAKKQGNESKGSKNSKGSGSMLESIQGDEEGDDDDEDDDEEEDEEEDDEEEEAGEEEK
jgi:CheY-like chemotaxis protein